jgi:hypothetical protein
MVVVGTDQHLFTVDTELDGTAVRLVLRVGDATPTECGGLSIEIAVVGTAVVTPPAVESNRRTHPPD